MEYQFQTQTKSHRVKLHRKDNEIQQVEIDDHAIAYEYRTISENCYSIIINGESYTVYHAQENQSHYIFVKGELFELAHVTHKKDHGTQQHDEMTIETEIRAPMPGKLLKILVVPGDRVQARQPLFIVESMKMENQVQAPMAGRVEKINRQANDLVTTGDVIIELAQEESQ